MEISNDEGQDGVRSRRKFIGGVLVPLLLLDYPLRAEAAMTLPDYSALRAYGGTARTVILTRDGIAGAFQLDADDVSSADNGGTIIVDAAGRRWRRITDHVTPEMFGGGVNSLITAANAAASAGLPLITGSGPYTCDISFAGPQNLAWECRDTRVTQNSDRADAAGFAPGSGTVQTGRLTITMGDYPGPGVGRAAVRLDDTQNRMPQVSNVRMDTIVCLGGHNNANGVAAMGGASNIRIKRIECPTSAKYGRPFLAHWGNFQDHYYDSATSQYKHVVGALPTTHPHDIQIDEIVCGDLTFSGADVSAAFISAGYDIHIGRVVGGVFNDLNGSAIVTVSAGDLGFAYSNIKTIRMRNIRIGSIEGQTKNHAYREIGRALYAAADETPQSDDLYDGVIDIEIGSINSVGRTEGAANNNCVVLTNGRGKTKIGLITATNFNHVVFAGNYSSNVSIREVDAKDTRRNPLMLLGYGSDPAIWPRGYSIGALRMDNYGTQSGATALERRGVRAEKIIGAYVGQIIVDRVGSGTDPFYSDTRNGGSGIGVGDIRMMDSSYNISYLITNMNNVSDPISIGAIFDVSGAVTTAMSGGTSILHRGRFREITVYGDGSVPAGIRVNKTDRIVAQFVGAAGRPFSWYVDIAGVTGTDAVLIPISARV
ncbi:hypothetical protein [Brachymonas wangyanguii]|uniref:hypothetical protein n=1 Tax=Brachymonas wangyanguii TaxID=3130163 RepID=UPI00307F1AAC